MNLNLIAENLSKSQLSLTIFLGQNPFFDRYKKFHLVVVLNCLICNEASPLFLSQLSAIASQYC